MGGVVDQHHEQRAADSALAAAGGRGVDLEGVLLLFQLLDAESEVEIPRHVDQLHVVGGLDRDDLLFGGLIVRVVRVAVVLVRVVCVVTPVLILVDEDAVLDERAG